MTALVKRTRAGALMALALALTFGDATDGAAQSAPESARPDIVREALAGGLAVSERPWAFTQIMASDGGRMVLRHDPRRADMPWTLVEPAPEDASSEVIQVFEGVRDSGRDGAALGYRRLDETLGGEIALAREEAEALVFRFDPRPGPDADGRMVAFLDNLDGEIVVSVDGAGPEGADPWVRAVRLYAPDSFKPNLAARIKRFEQTARYELTDGLPILAESATRISGRAMFQSFEENVTITISDVEAVAPGDVAAAPIAAEAVDTISRRGAEEPVAPVTPDADAPDGSADGPRPDSPAEPAPDADAETPARDDTAEPQPASDAPGEDEAPAPPEEDTPPVEAADDDPAPAPAPAPAAAEGEDADSRR